MANWLPKRLPPHRTALAMIGVKAGNRIVVAGAAAPDLAAELARITGLNGQTLVVDSDASAVARVEAAAARAGALVDVKVGAIGQDLIERDAFDVAVLLLPLGTLSSHDRQTIVAALVGSLRPGGRLIVVDGTPARGFLAGLSRPVNLPSDEVLRLLEAGGSRAQRHLGAADGVSYYEGLKSRE
jgi:SAM-dependent methyltransferase